MKRLAVALALVAVYFSLVTSSPAQTPSVINYQGKLINGTNLVNATVGVSLRICTNAIGGDVLYEDSNSVTVVDGLYSTLIGDNTTAGTLTNALAAAGAKYIEVAINGTALSPREPLASVSYALVAAGTPAGAIITSMLADQAVTGNKIANYSISNENLVAESIQADRLRDDSIGLVQLDVSDVDTRYVKKSGDTMTGTLTVQTNINSAYNADRGSGVRSMLTIGGGQDVEIGSSANGYVYGVAVGLQANGYSEGVGIGREANGSTDGVAAGYQANASDRGIALGLWAKGSVQGVGVGQLANGADRGVAIGLSANGYTNGVAAGYQANGADRGVALGSDANGSSFGVAVGLQANGNTEGVAIGREANGSTDGVAAGYQANAFDRGIALGLWAKGSVQGVGVGQLANGVTNGAAVGLQANGSDHGAGVGAQANGNNSGAAVGYNSVANDSGAALGKNANGYFQGVAVGSGATGTAMSVAVGSLAFGGGNGVAVGFGAMANVSAVAVGASANGNASGAAVGLEANGASGGAAVGLYANGYNYGAAVGNSASAYGDGAAVGFNSDGTSYGAAVGEKANGYNYGAALGFEANGFTECVAIGALANAKAVHCAAIGYQVTNDVADSTRIRGDLYIDGGTKVWTNGAVGAANWGVKAFTIDHPLDPQNKVLRHFCVEGPVVQNMYNGSVTLDGKGEAMVAMPPYFEKLNTNPQYVLTAVGASMPNLHVMQKIHDNRFWIAGGSPAGEVSWMVIAQRNDPACVEDLKNRPVEQLKRELKPGQTAEENQSVNTTAVSQ